MKYIVKSCKTKDNELCFSGAPSALYVQTNPDETLSINFGYQQPVEHPGRYERAAQRKQKKQKVEIAESLLQLSSTLPETEMDPDTASCTFL